MEAKSIAEANAKALEQYPADINRLVNELVMVGKKFPRIDVLRVTFLIPGVPRKRDRSKPL